MPSPMPIGFNLRQASGYVTDVAPDTYTNKGIAYSSSPGYGWNDISASGADVTNRSTSVNPRLAGVLYVPNVASPANAEFRIDTGTGAFNFTLAMGDAGDISGPHKLELFDGANGTAILTLTGAALTAGQFYDATGALHTSAANWVSNNTAAAITLSNSYLRVRIGGGTGGGGDGYTHVAHFSLAAASPPNPPTGVTGGSVTPTGFTVSWTDASSDETGFKVQYAPSPYSSWTTASGSPTAANATSLTITGLADGTSYKARVASTNANGDSAWVESGVETVGAPSTESKRIGGGLNRGIARGIY